jgi:hypothetical protein
MIELANKLAEFFHTTDGEAFASIKIDDHNENLKVRDQSFSQWLRRLYYQQTKKSAGKEAIKSAIDTLEAQGLFDGEEIPLELRYAKHEDNIYIDLGNKDWNQVKITKNGWDIIGSKDSPVKFFRTKGMIDMPEPHRNGSIETLKNLLNIECDDDWVLIVSWLLGAMNPSGPYPVLLLQGEQGTAKSTTAKLLRNLVDPSTVPLQSMSRSERDLAITASNSWILNFDNLSNLRASISNALCRISTGGGFRTRKLYTDDEEKMFTARRPMIMNGISDLTSRHDLADRSLIIQLPVIKERHTEGELMDCWDICKPVIFGALCNGLSVALANEQNTKIADLPRMADWAKWVTAAESAFSWKEGTFLNAFQKNREQLIDISLEGEPVAIAALRLAHKNEGGEFNATPTEVLKVLTESNPDLVSDTSWPRTPNSMSRRLFRAAPFLRAKGVEVERSHSGGRGIGIWLNNQEIDGDDIEIEDFQSEAVYQEHGMESIASGYSNNVLEGI